MSRKIAALLQQFRSNNGSNLLYPAAPEHLRLDSSFLEILQEATEEDLSDQDLDSLITFAAEQCIRDVLEFNQYLQISDSARNRLKDIYRMTWETIQQTTDISAVLRHQHFPALQVWLAELYPVEISSKLSTRQTISAVCCSEYSPALQLVVLNVDIANLRAPVLDIGCGTSAALVRYLQSRDIEAAGFDRIVDTETESIRCGDWFTYDYAVHPWGTIISHMAFSNHYRYAVRYDQDMRRRLDTVCSRILGALSPGGRFIYAPAVPELESGVDENRYRILQWHSPEGFTSTVIERKAIP